MRPQRSWLYVPGDRPERFAKALGSGADAVILDLEDAVAAAARPAAIAHVDAFLAAHRPAGNTSVWVRVDDAVRRDPAVSALARHAALAGFVIPKFETPAQVAGWGKPVLALIETPRGVVDAARITATAAAAADLHGIALGPEDLSTALGVTPSAGALTHAAATLVMAAFAAGVAVYACPGSLGDFRDLDAWRATLLAGRGLGSQGSLCIHPAQVGPAHAVFSPSTAELTAAQRICEAWEQAAGQGAVALDGRMIDLPVLQRARDTLARAPR